jgi:hypothetical protein
MSIQQILLGLTTPTATWNPSDKAAAVTLSGGNLTTSITSTGSTDGGVRATVGISGANGNPKRYWEHTMISTSTGDGHVYVAVGIATSTANLNGPGGALGRHMWNEGSASIDDTTSSTYPAGADPTHNFWVPGDVVGVLLDMGTGTLGFSLNGVFQGTMTTGLSGTYYPFVINGDSISSITSVVTTNFGSSAFLYPPDGYGPVS